MPSVPQRTSAAPHGHMAELGLGSLGPQMSRFRGVGVVLPITRKNRNIKALNLYFSAVKSSRARNSKTEGVFDNSYGVACRRSLKLGADRTPERRSGIRANSERLLKASPQNAPVDAPGAYQAL